MNWGQRLRKAREKAGVTQAALAARLRVGKRTVEHWERGERLPPAAKDAITRERVMEALASPSNNKGSQPGDQAQRAGGR